MATDVELVFKGWLRKSTVTDPTKRKSSFLGRSSNNWKKKFFLLLKRTEDGTDIPYLEYHEKECTAEAENPKGSLRMWPTYRVEKKHDSSGKTFTFELRTPEETYRMQADSETNMDLWVFYCQIQTKLRPDFPGHFFEVTPSDSDSMRRIGAKGSKCLLHISPWGVTLALKRTKSLLAQWPLTCIRMFESSEKGDLSLDAGRSAPMGEAQYIFQTAEGQDGQMYDLLDDYTTELIRRQQKENPSSPPQPASEEEVAEEYERFRQATVGILHGTKPRSASLHTTSPSASMAVPVHPTRGPPQRPSRNQRPSIPTPNIPRNISQPAFGSKERPPLPPRNHPSMTHSVSAQAIPLTYSSPYDTEYTATLDVAARAASGRTMPQTYSSPYDTEDTATLDAAARGAVGGPMRGSATESEIMGMSSRTSSNASGHMHGSRRYQHRLSNPSSQYGDSPSSLQVPMVYENTPKFGASFEHSGGGISLSPQDMMMGGFSNSGFIASPSPGQSLSKSPWYHEIRAGYVPGSMPRTEILHTYLDPQSVRGTPDHSATHYASPPAKLSVLIPQPGSLTRSLSFDNIFPRLSMSSSVGSPMIEPLDLASSLNYASPRLDVDLPKTPSHTGLPPEANMYIGIPRVPMSSTVTFPQGRAATAQDKIGYEQMVNQRVMQSDYEQMAKQQMMQSDYEQMARQQMIQSSNNNNPRPTVPSSSSHYMVQNPASMQSAPLAMLSGAIPVGGMPYPKMKRSHSEADLLDSKTVQEPGYMFMKSKAALFAGYMDMENKYLARLKKKADQEAKKKLQARSGFDQDIDARTGINKNIPAQSGITQQSLQVGGSQHYMIPRKLTDPQETMTEKEIKHSLQLYGTTGRKKSRLKKFFGNQTPEADTDTDSESPKQSRRRSTRSPSQTLLRKLKRAPKKGSKQSGDGQKKMVRSRSEADLGSVLQRETGYMDMRTAYVGSQGQMRRSNSDFDLLDDNLSTASGDSGSLETPDRIVYLYRKKFQSNTDEGGISHIPVPAAIGDIPAANGTAVKPASHSGPSSAPFKKKKFLSMFRSGSKDKPNYQDSPDISSTESSPDLSRASRFSPATTPPQTAPKPKLSKLKIPGKSISTGDIKGIVASNNTRSFSKPKTPTSSNNVIQSSGKPKTPKSSEGNSTFYVSEDHTTLAEYTNRPLPSLPRGMAPSRGSHVTGGGSKQYPQIQEEHAPIVPMSKSAPNQGYQDVKMMERVQRLALTQQQNANYIDEYMPTGQQQWMALTTRETTPSSVTDNAQVRPELPARPAIPIPARPVPMPHHQDASDGSVVRLEGHRGNEDNQDTSPSRSTSYV